MYVRRGEGENGKTSLSTNFIYCCTVFIYSNLALYWCGRYKCVNTVRTVHYCTVVRILITYYDYVVDSTEQFKQ